MAYRYSSRAAELVFDHDAVANALDLADAAIAGGEPEPAYAALSRFMRDMDLQCHHGTAMPFHASPPLPRETTHIARSVDRCAQCEEELGPNGSCLLGLGPDRQATLYGFSGKLDDPRYLCVITVQEWQARVLALGSVLAHVEQAYNARVIAFYKARDAAVTLLEADARAVGAEMRASSKTVPSATIYRAATAAVI